MNDPHDDTDVPSGTTDGAQMESTSPPVNRRVIATERASFPLVPLVPLVPQAPLAPLAPLASPEKKPSALSRNKEDSISRWRPRYSSK